MRFLLHAVIGSLCCHQVCFSEVLYSDGVEFPEIRINDSLLQTAKILTGFSATERYPKLLLVRSETVTTRDGNNKPERPGWNSVLVKVNDKWRGTLIPFDYSGVRYIGRTPSGRFAYIVLDNEAESPGSTLEIVRSTDGGVTWSFIASVKKSTYWALFYDFTMDETTGIGSLTIHHDYDLVDIGYPNPGFYIYRTRDFGASWYGPDYVPSSIESKRATFGTETFGKSKLISNPDFSIRDSELIRGEERNNE